MWKEDESLGLGHGIGHRGMKNGDEAIIRDEEGAALVSLGNLRLLEGLRRP